MKLTEALDEFIVDQHINGNSPNTIAYYKRVLSAFLAFCADSEALDTSSVTLLLCKRFVVALQADDRKNTVSVQSYVRGLRSFLTWCYKSEYISSDIPAKLKLPKARRIVKDILTDSEIDRLFATFDEGTFLGLRNACIVAFMLGSGLRRNEVVTLRAENLHLDSGYALVTGKGDKQRHVPIGAIASEKLVRYLKARPASPWLFVQENGAPITEVTLKQLFRKLKTRSGITRLHPHLLRHTFATLYLQNGGNIYTLQTILGHTSLDMVKKYLHIAPCFVVSDFAEHSPLDIHAEA